MRSAICDRCSKSIEPGQGSGELKLFTHPGGKRVSRIDLCQECWGVLVKLVDEYEEFPESEPAR